MEDAQALWRFCAPPEHPHPPAARELGAGAEAALGGPHARRTCAGDHLHVPREAALVRPRPCSGGRPCLRLRGLGAQGRPLRPPSLRRGKHRRPEGVWLFVAPSRAGGTAAAPRSIGQGDEGGREPWGALLARAAPDSPWTAAPRTIAFKALLKLRPRSHRSLGPLGPSAVRRSARLGVHLRASRAQSHRTRRCAAAPAPATMLPSDRCCPGARPEEPPFLMAEWRGRRLYGVGGVLHGGGTQAFGWQAQRAVQAGRNPAEFDAGT